jgi:hypothetical protein
MKLSSGRDIFSQFQLSWKPLPGSGSQSAEYNWVKPMRMNRCVYAALKNLFSALIFKRRLQLQQKMNTGAAKPDHYGLWRNEGHGIHAAACTDRIQLSSRKPGHLTECRRGKPARQGLLRPPGLGQL